jgi:hypothetical protein
MKWIFLLSALVVSCGGGPTGPNGSFDSIAAKFRSESTQIDIVSTPQNTRITKISLFPPDGIVVDTVITGIQTYERFRYKINDALYFTLPELIPDTIGTSEGHWETTMRFDLRTHSVLDRSMPGDPVLFEFYNEVFELARELN